MATGSILILTAIISCLVSLAFLLRGLIIEGPAFYNGQECTMTYSRFQFLPLQVSSPLSNRYRLLKFTDGRDPRHQHFYPISGSLVEDYRTQTAKKRHRTNNNGRVLELHDNWCLLPREEINKNTSHIEWSDVPYPHRGHPVLYVPGHWGSFSQSRSLGAHGTRWTGQYYHDANADRKIFESLRSGTGMYNGTQLSVENFTEDVELMMGSLSSQYLDGFVMDVFALDFGDEGAALHSSKILNQADFFASAIETMVEGCHLGDSQIGITIVAHSIGAWAVKASLDMNPHLVSKGWVKNVINLASPLQSIPYAVDSGVHDIVKTLNERGSDTKRNVAMVSVSGGLRDELIPPSLSRGQSESFLASSILEMKAASKANTKFGMDHRCIVWCYDLLTQIREVVFMLAVTTDRGMNPSERLNIVRMTFRRRNHTQTFEDEVKTLHKRAVDAKGYPALVSVQLAAPYYLNCLLKLCILVGLAHSLLLWPLFLQHRRQPCTNQKEFKTTCMEVSISLLVIPIIVTMSSLIRRLEFHSFGWSLRLCYMHECELLVGTIFVLTQLAALFYFIVVYGVGFGIDKISCKLGLGCLLSQGQHQSGKTFATVLGYCSMRSLRLYPVAYLPLAVGVSCVATTMNENGQMSIVPTLFVSTAIFILGCLLKLIFKPNATNLEERRIAFVILLVSHLKATYGKVIYAYSMMEGVGPANNWYSDEVLVSFTSSSLPTFLAIMAIETHDVMTQNALLEWKRRTKSENENTGVDIGFNKTHRVFIVTNTCVFIWYMWNVLVNYSGDDIVVSLYSILTVAVSYWKCYPLSADAMNVFAAVIDDELSFHFEFKDKDE